MRIHQGNLNANFQLFFTLLFELPHGRPHNGGDPLAATSHIVSVSNKAKALLLLFLTIPADCCAVGNAFF